VVQGHLDKDKDKDIWYKDIWTSNEIRSFHQESQSSSSSFNNSFEGGFGGDLLKDMNRMPGMSMRPMKRMDEMLGFGNMGLDMGMKDADFFSGMPGHPLPGMPGMLQVNSMIRGTMLQNDITNY
jgi:hypothetical protein